jgi:hypothetical protein
MSSLTEELSTLKQENAELAGQLDKLDRENEQIKGQLHTLSGVRQQVSFDDIHSLQGVIITRYTNLYDKDEDGKKEKLIVYLQPVDREGDVVKAPGSVQVQLWDLEKSENEALLGEWTVGPDELKKLWFSAVLGTNYRLTFDVADKVEKFQGPLTVKVVFTDHLSGSVFKEQKVIKPR